ncbi:hypothetical protein PULV_a1536 [Pseudoalteromonas ulvae UL12]|nr:hypothetical protein [Pseudoalteromonas ulvae UL12]
MANATNDLFFILLLHTQLKLPLLNKYKQQIAIELGKQNCQLVEFQIKKGQLKADRILCASNLG